MIVKELLAKFGLDYDKTSFKEADGMINGLIGSAGKLIGAYAGFQGLKIGFGLAREAAQFEDAKRIFDASGQSLEEFRKISKGVLSDQSLVTNFNLASQFGITKDEFLEFVTIADAAAKKLGKSQEYVFDSLIKGVARKSAPFLDNAGIILDAEQVYKKAAARLGKSVSNLSTTETREALKANILGQGREIVASVTKAGAAAGAGASDFYDQWDSAFSNTKIALGKALDAVVKDFLKPIVDWARTNREAINAFATTLAKVLPKALKIASYALVFFGVRSLGIAILNLKKMIIQLMIVAGSHIVAAAGAFDQAVWTTYLAGATNMTSAAITVLIGRVRALIVSFLTGPIAIGLLLAAIVLLGEEIDAAFDPKKLGLFELMSGQWNKFRDKLMTDIKAEDFSLMTVLKAVLVVITTLFNTFDKLFNLFLMGINRVIEAISIDLPLAIGKASAALAKIGLDPKVGWNAVKSLATAPFSAAASLLGGAASIPSSNAGARGTQVNAESNLTVNVDAAGANPGDRQLARNIAAEVVQVHKDALKAAQSFLTPAKASP